MANNFYIVRDRIVTNYKQAIGDDGRPIIGMISCTQLTEEPNYYEWTGSREFIKSEKPKVVQFYLDSKEEVEVISDSTTLYLSDSKGNPIALEDLLS